MVQVDRDGFQLVFKLNLTQLEDCLSRSKSALSPGPDLRQLEGIQNLSSSVIPHQELAGFQDS